MRPYLSQLRQFRRLRRLLCVATTSSLAQLRVGNGSREAEATWITWLPSCFTPSIYTRTKYTLHSSVNGLLLMECMCLWTQPSLVPRLLSFPVFRGKESGNETRPTYWVGVLCVGVRYPAKQRFGVCRHNSHFRNYLIYISIHMIASPKCC